MRKQLVSLILILLITISSGMVGFSCLRGLARLKMGMSLCIHAGEEFIFSAEELKGAKWENEREFYLNGVLYDVRLVEYQLQGNLFHCCIDKLENKLQGLDAITNSVTDLHSLVRNNIRKNNFSWVVDLYLKQQEYVLREHTELAIVRLFSWKERVDYAANLLTLIVPPEASSF